ncbi:MAG TPA: amidase [Hyphomonadaceae bacterium]|nr:amidase [Hyphomonadaceae bacterium]
MRLTRRSLLSTISAAGLAACAPKETPAVAAKPPEPSHDLPDATELASLIRNKQVTAAEAVEAAIKRADAAQPKLHFMVSDTYALARARAAEPLTGPFAGVPSLIKDLNSVIGAVTREGSRGTGDRKPATKQDAFITAAMATGIVCIAKSATPEYGYLPTTEPLAFGPTHNPWELGHSSGGSSGGSAAAVAAGVVPIAHANDGGGSIRIPACNCGLVGLKPSTGRFIADQPGARPLDIAVQGCVSRTVRDTAAFFAAVEATGGAAVFPPVGLVTGASGTKRKVGFLLKGLTGDAPDPEVAAVVQAVVKLLEGGGHTITGETNWPVTPAFMDDFVNLWSLGAANDVAEMAKETGKKIDETMMEPFSLQMAANAAKLKPAEIEGVQKRLIAASAAYDKWIAGFDVVVSPVLATPAPELGFVSGDVPFETLRTRLLHYVGYTPIHNVAEAAAISLPMGMSSAGLPIGVQISAPKGGEKVLLELAYELEAAQPWIKKRPGVWTG